MSPASVEHLLTQKVRLLARRESPAIDQELENLRQAALEVFFQWQDGLAKFQDLTPFVAILEKKVDLNRSLLKWEQEHIADWSLHLALSNIRAYCRAHLLCHTQLNATPIITMKHIIPLGNNRYIHLDLGEKYRSSITKLLVPILVIAIASIVAGAIVGIDITNIQPMPQHQTKWTPM